MGSCFSTDKTSNVSLQLPFISQSDHNSSLSLHPYMNRIHEITTEKELNLLINDIHNVNVLIVCDFYANWCPPCVQIAPILHRWVSHDYKSRAIFIKIDADENNDLFNTFSITVLPTFVFFKQGKEIYRLTGADQTKLKREIDNFI